MPTYEYRCKDCGHEMEAVQSFHDDPLSECPSCGGALRKKFGRVGISFKGSGFYKTDSRPSSSSPDKSGSDKAAPEKAGAEKSEGDKTAAPSEAATSSGSGGDSGSGSAGGSTAKGNGTSSDSKAAASA